MDSEIMSHINMLKVKTTWKTWNLRVLPWLHKAIDRSFSGIYHCAKTSLSFILFPPGQALNDLSKDKTNAKSVENNSTQFLRTLVEVGRGLSGHINYLTQVSTGMCGVG